MPDEFPIIIFTPEGKVHTCREGVVALLADNNMIYFCKELMRFRTYRGVTLVHVTSFLTELQYGWKSTKL